eukprot:CAMPEP_0194344442 /NCGR_PEP_ID=MMETSP0171-20130528/101487_1 /TAXON_ID=218684 /ORGANISM="Corethron pennatum, Strain L29A3" /LENGTH=52 /DNA_ID=CAMNT_0039111111 /DNA_START=57 /DNA_END=215 /DNA_ORIENTATION=-
MMMAIPPLRHLSWLGHAASSHTVAKEEKFYYGGEEQKLSDLPETHAQAQPRI